MSSRALALGEPATADEEVGAVDGEDDDDAEDADDSFPCSDIAK